MGQPQYINSARQRATRYGCKWDNPSVALTLTAAAPDASAAPVPQHLLLMFYFLVAVSQLNSRNIAVSPINIHKLPAISAVSVISICLDAVVKMAATNHFIAFTWTLITILLLCKTIYVQSGYILKDDFVYFQLHQPSDVAYIYPVLPAKDFGRPFVHVHRNIKLVPSAPALGCEPLTNNLEIEGQVGFVQRGTCSFVEKAFHVQQAGGVAAIIYDNDEDDTWIDMIAEDLDYAVNIPALFMLGVDGQRIIASLETNGLGMADVTIPLNSSLVSLTARPWALW
eukprot:gene7029-9608_t